LAVDSIRDPEQNLGNILLAPGFVKTHLTNKLLAVADERQDVLAIIDLEGDYHPEAEATNSDTQQSRRGNVKDIVSNLKTRNLDTSFGCAFAPWIQISDNLNGSELVWVPPSIAGLGAMARSEAASDVWFAPAGFNRGGLGSLGGPSGPTVVQARQRLDVKDRDKLYGIGINPIASFPNEGVVVFGQKTLQKANSALDRINVRRLMIYLKREIGNVAKQTLFQNNVPATWADFRGRAEPILSDVKNRFGLTDYRLILDETTTTPDLIDRNIMYAKVFLKPARAIEYIAIDFVITKTGADFV
jgi:phage tail sheath protein FI